MNTLEIKKTGIKVLFGGLTLVLLSILIGCSKSTQSVQNIQPTPSSISVLTPTHTVEAIPDPTATPKPLTTLSPAKPTSKPKHKTTHNQPTTQSTNS